MVLEWIYDALFPKSNKAKRKEQAFERLELKDPIDVKREFFKTGVDVLKKAGTALTLASPPTSASGVASLLAKGDIVDKLEKLTFNNAFKYYGKYGGPSYSAGKYTEPGQIITSRDIQENPPDDELDKLYLEHDLRYQLASTEEDPEKRKQETRKADEIFIRDAERLSKKSLGFVTQGALKASVLAFKAKLATDIGYNVDRETNPDAKTVARKHLNLKNYDNPNFIMRSLNQVSDANDKFKVKNFKDLPKQEKIDLINYLLEDD